MSSDTVVLLYDSYMVGTLPEDEDRISNEIQFMGTDGTTIVIKGNSETIYREEPQRMFEGTPDDSKTVLFEFKFPLGTEPSEDSTVFTTPSRSVYRFSTKNGVIIHNDLYHKTVSEGTIQITPPVPAGTVPPTPVIVSAVNNFVNEDIPMGGDYEYMKNNPFVNVLYIVYLVVSDLITLLVFWIIVISISCWVMIPSDYLYPTDVTKYPYIFYENKGTRYYDYLTNDAETICKNLTESTTERMMTEQKAFFEKLNAFIVDDKTAEYAELLKKIYPGFLMQKPQSVSLFSTSLMNTCKKTKDLGISDYFFYLVTIVLFHNYLYCSSTLSMIHTMLSAIYNTLEEAGDTKLPVLDFTVVNIFFAGLLFILFFSSSQMNQQTIELLDIKFKEEKDMNSVVLNQLTKFSVYLLTCALFIFGTLFPPVLLVCVAITVFTLGRLSFINAYTPSIGAFAFCMLCAGFINYSLLGAAAAGAFPIEDMFKLTGNEGGDSTFSALVSFFSIFSIGIPVIMAAGYSLWVAGTFMISIVTLSKLDFFYNRVKKTFPTLVILAFVFLYIRVQEVLGATYGFITLAIMGLIGAGIAMSKS